MADAASYMCVAENSAGSVEKLFTLRVQGELGFAGPQGPRQGGAGALGMNCAGRQHLVPPRGAPGAPCVLGTRLHPELGVLAWHQPCPSTESIWGALITKSHPQMILSNSRDGQGKALLRPYSTIIKCLLCTWPGADSFQQS